MVATAAQARFVAQYPTEAVAALGIVKKLDQLPLYFSIGVSNGLLPLLAYNHAAGTTGAGSGPSGWGLPSPSASPWRAWCAMRSSRTG